MELMVNCWDRKPLGKGWRVRPGWNWNHLGSSSQQVNWEEGNELASPWLLFLGRRWCSETLKWSSAVPWALQLVLPYSSPPCCLRCHRHPQPASSTIHPQHISQRKSFLPLFPTKRGQRSTNFSCSSHACTWQHLVRGIYVEGGSFTLPHFLDVIQEKNTVWRFGIRVISFRRSLLLHFEVHLKVLKCQL